VFERLGELEAQAYGTESRLGELADAAKAAKLDLIAYTADREVERVAGREAYLGGLEARRVEFEQAEANYQEELRRHGSGISGSARRLREDWETMTVADQREALSRVLQAVFVRRTPPENGKRVKPANPVVLEGRQSVCGNCGTVIENPGKRGPRRRLCAQCNGVALEGRQSICEFCGEAIENPGSRGPRRRFHARCEQLDRAEQRSGANGNSRAPQAGASAENVWIVWQDEPEVDLPRPGRADFVLRPFVFPNGADDPGDTGKTPV
jgi:hypothetical protein